MKTPLSLIPLFLCAAGMPLFAETIEGYPVIVYDTSDSPVALGRSLNDISDYLNGSEGDKAELYSDDTISRTVVFDRDSYWKLVSDCDEVRTLSGKTTFFESSSGTLKVILDKIAFTGASGDIFSSSGGGMIYLGGNAGFKNNSSSVIAGNVEFLENSNMTFLGNTCDRVISGRVLIGSGANLVFAQNGAGIHGSATGGDNSTLTFSNNTGTGIYGNANFGNNFTFSGSGNSACVINGSTIAFGDNAKLTFSGNTNGVIRGNTTVGIGSILVAFNNRGTIFDGSLTLGADSAATFEGNTSASSSVVPWVINGSLTIGERSSVIINNSNGISGAVLLSTGGSLSVVGGKRGGCSGLTSLSNTYCFFSENLCAIDGELVIGPNSEAIFLNNFSTAQGSAVRGNVSVGAGATATFSGNSGGAVYGNVSIESGATATFSGDSGNFGAVRGDVSVGAGAIATFSGNSDGAVYGNVSIESGATATFSGNSQSSGGAVYGNVCIESGSIVTFSGNSTSNLFGGAVRGDVSIESGATVTFSGNSSANDGGAIYSRGTLDFAGNVKFQENSVLNGYAGAIYSRILNFNTEIIGEKIIFLKNESHRGGALFVDESLSASFASNVEFIQNSASGSGGAIYGLSSASMSLAGTLNFEKNTASWSGGAIFAKGCLSFLSNSKNTFSKNSANDSGGAILAESSLMFYKGSDTEFSGNTAMAKGGAICGDVSSYMGSGLLFRGNSARFGGAIYGAVVLLGGISTFTQNVVEDGSGGAIYSSGTTTISGNTEFTGNAVSYTLMEDMAMGGAISSATSVSFASTAMGTFSGNSITATQKVDTRGGAIYSATVSIAGDLVFENNTISAIGSTSINSGGGAIYADGAVTFSSETNAKFIGNAITSSATQSFGGGAIFADTIELAGKVEFTNNAVTNSTISTMFSSGGAIFAFSGLEFTDGTIATFSGNSAAYGGAINSYKGYLTFSEGAVVTFSGNSAARGGAIYVDAGTFTLAGDVQFFNNTASAQGGAIRLGESTLVCEGDTTKIVFSGNRVGSDSKGWKNNDILLVKAISSMLIQDTGTYEFGGGIDAKAGGSLSISEATVAFKTGAENVFGGNVTIADGANVTLEKGVTFDLQRGVAMSVGSDSILKLETNLSEATVITVHSGASITFDVTAKLIIDVSTAETTAMLSSRDALLCDVAKIAIIRAEDEIGIGGIENVELLLNGSVFNGDWSTSVEGNSLYLTMAIPEPSMFGLLSGLGALTLVVSRRRRRS